MPKINLLDSTIYNRISAGEVVEKPASVVKELIENSLDAGASFVSIEIENGGTKSIKVCDNGSGVLYEDLKNAFLPHATSKISNVDDLDFISTLGFRGEALASIASVSQIEMTSKTVEQDLGGKIKVEGGKMFEPQPFACTNGTTTIVKNLFYNVPARLKFLKSEKQEESAVTNIVNRLMLSNPDICFKYIVDGKTVYNSVLKGLKEKIFTIYGKETTENLIEINFKNQSFKLSGFVSLPSFCKANKTYQTIVVNNRYISNSLISVALSNAYENFLMKGKFPFFVLNLDLDFADIDVNVHPSKMEIKFKNTKEIYNLFYSTILESLTKNNCPVVFKTNSCETQKDNFVNATSEIQAEKFKEIKGGFSFGDLQNFNAEIKNLNVSSPTYKENFDVLSSCENSFVSQKINEKITEFNNKTTQEQQEIFMQNYKIIGTILNTYIIVESGSSLYIFDQHAGHERILYDKFIKQFKEKSIEKQQLLLPYVFSVNNIENDLIEENIDVFKIFGFDIEAFGNLTYKISSVPVILSDINLKNFIDETLKDIEKISFTNEKLKDFFAIKACKSAVKGGQKLSEDEIKFLLNEIVYKKTTLLCPHGRPICVKFTQNEIEKMFKRIV